MTAGPEQRKFRRYPLSFPLTLLFDRRQDANPADGIQCLLTNLSLEGMAVQSTKLLPIGTPLSFAFTLTQDESCVVEEATIVHSRPQNGPGYLAGIRLTRFRKQDHYKLAKFLKTLRLIQNSALLFQKLSLDEVRTVVALCKEVRLAKHQMLFSENDEALAMYIILDGTIQLFLNHGGQRDETIANLENGEMFGEMALLDGHARAASARAQQPTTLLSLDRNQLLNLLNDRTDLSQKIMWVFLRMLSHRLRLADKRFVELLSIRSKEPLEKP